MPLNLSKNGNAEGEKHVQDPAPRTNLAQVADRPKKEASVGLDPEGMNDGSEEVKNLAHVAERAKKEARDWELKYAALRKSRVSLESTQAQQLAALQVYVSEQEDAKAATSSTIRDLESLLLKERHRSERLQAQLDSYPTHLEGQLEVRLNSLELCVSSVENSTGRSYESALFMKGRLISSKEVARDLRGKVFDSRHETMSAQVAAEAHASAARNHQQLLDAAHEQQVALSCQIKELEACLEAERQYNKGLQTERLALVQAIQTLHANKGLRESESPHLADQANASESIEVMCDTVQNLEKTLKNVDRSLDRLLRESRVKMNRMLEKNFMLRCCSVQMAADLEGKDRLVSMLEEQLRVTHDHVLVVEMERASVQSSILHWHAERDKIDAESSFFRQCLLETTAQLAHAKKNSVSFNADCACGTIGRGLDEVAMIVAFLESVLPDCSSRMEAREQHWLSTVKSLEEENSLLEISVLDSLREAEDALRKVRSRGQRISGTEEDCFAAAHIVSHQAQVQILKDDIQRLEAVVTLKQQRIVNLERVSLSHVLQLADGVQV